MSVLTSKSTSEPLQSHRLFKTQDVDEARHIVGGHFCSHKLIPGSLHKDFEACHNRAAGNMLSLNYLRYTSETVIKPGELDQFYLVQLPLCGTAVVSNGAHTVHSTRQTGSLLNPTRETHMTWHAGCEQLLVQIDRHALHRLAESLLGQPLCEPIVFNTGMPTTTPALQTWHLQLRQLVEATEQNIAFTQLASSSQMLREENLILGLLRAQQSTISHMLQEPQRRTMSAQMKRAQSFMHDNVSDALSLQQIAEHAGCSIRSLQVGFKQHFQCSPMRYLSRQRLNLAHYLLQSSSSDATVSSIAYDCGFTHLGRFSIEYKRVFGCLPSESLAMDAGD